MASSMCSVSVLSRLTLMRRILLGPPAALLMLGLSANHAFAACSAANFGTSVIFTCDGATDTSTFSASGGLLQHNRPVSEGFASFTDFDPATSGVQTLPVDATSQI